MHLKYPRLTFGLFLFIALNLIFLFSDHTAVTAEINKFGYWSFLVLGSLYTFSFTTGIATGAFLSYIPDGNIFLYSLIGGAGAVVSDLIIYKIIKSELDGEIKKLQRSRLVKYLSLIPGITNKYVLAFIGIVTIATPLPDELSVALLAENKLMKKRYFIPIALLMNTIGIYVLLSVIPEVTP